MHGVERIRRSSAYKTKQLKSGDRIFDNSQLAGSRLSDAERLLPNNTKLLLRRAKAHAGAALLIA